MPPQWGFIQHSAGVTMFSFHSSIVNQKHYLCHPGGVLCSSYHSIAALLFRIATYATWWTALCWSGGCFHSIAVTHGIPSSSIKNKSFHIAGSSSKHQKCVYYITTKYLGFIQPKLGCFSCSLVSPCSLA